MTDEKLRAVFQEAVDQYDSIEDQIEHARKSLKGMPRAWRNELLRIGIAEMVHRARCESNTLTRNSLKGEHPKNQNQVAAGMAGVGAVAAATHERREFMRMFICGMFLGEMQRSDLERAASSEEEKAAGHGFNAAFCRALVRKLGGEETVSEAMTEEQLRKIYERVKRGRAV